MSKAINNSNDEKKLFSGSKKGNKRSKKKSKEKIEKNSDNITQNNNEELYEEKKDLNEDNNIENLINERNIDNEGKGLMLTELLDINNEKEKKKDGNEGVIFLKNKYSLLETPSGLLNGIKLGINNCVKDIHQEISNEKLKISNTKKCSKSQISLLNKFKMSKNNGMITLSMDNKLKSKENLKRLNFLNKNEEYLKRNIHKLEENKKLIESLSYPKENIVEKNINTHKLKK
jgi:hypothetical protein